MQLSDASNAIPNQTTVCTNKTEVGVVSLCTISHCQTRWWLHFKSVCILITPATKLCCSYSQYFCACMCILKLTKSLETLWTDTAHLFILITKATEGNIQVIHPLFVRQNSKSERNTERLVALAGITWQLKKKKKKCHGRYKALGFRCNVQD